MHGVTYIISNLYICMQWILRDDTIYSKSAYLAILSHACGNKLNCPHVYVCNDT